MDRLWREMDLPAIVGSSTIKLHHSERGVGTAQEPQTTQQLVDSYYQHCDSRVELQRATDEQMLALHNLSEGADHLPATARVW